MAIIRLDCNLNGGDSVTPNNELFYRIYGNVDAYAAPIHTTGTALSDANVTVNNDNVIITGVDGTTNTSFKIAAVDGAGNEGIISDAVSSSIIIFEELFSGTVLNENVWTLTNTNPAIVGMEQLDGFYQFKALSATVTVAGEDNIYSIDRWNTDDGVHCVCFDLLFNIANAAQPVCYMGVSLVNPFESMVNVLGVNRKDIDEVNVQYDWDGETQEVVPVVCNVDDVWRSFKITMIGKQFTLYQWTGSWVLMYTGPVQTSAQDVGIAFVSQYSSSLRYNNVRNVRVTNEDFDTQYPV